LLDIHYLTYLTLPCPPCDPSSRISNALATYHNTPKNRSMKTTAAILVATDRPLELIDLEIPVLRPGQVLIEVSHSGVCHTQLLEVHGHRGEDKFLPHCLGHEGSGKVIEVGPDVSKCQPGDRVILSWMKGLGADVPGTVYESAVGNVNAGGLTTFQRHSVVSENRLTSLPAEISFRDAALLGCAVPTGLGAVRNTAQVKPGQSVAVFGTGGIGLCAIAAAAIAGADPLIAVDINASRLDIARQLGATTLINATDSDPVEQIQAMVAGGLDVAIEASGNPEVMRQALVSVRSRGGTVVVIGNVRHGQRLEIDPAQLNQGKRLLGTWGGDNEPDRDFPRYCELLVAGKLNLSPLLAKTYTLETINEALDDLQSGRVPRPLVAMQAE
jgi:S-(hydroxymethyl)glutathione dehydrogenase/alcohol dehydrogenase